MPRTWHVALLYAALTVALAHPLARHAAEHVLSVSPDTDLFLWTLSWDTYAFTHHPWSIFDANIFYPQPRTLAYSENLIGSGLFAAPILWLTRNPVLAMNLVALLSCVLCGVGGYVLARRAGVGLLGAALSGLIFAFTPPRFLRLDQLFLTTIQWVPFGLAYVQAYLDEGRPFDVRVAIAFFIGPPFGLWPLVHWLSGFNFIRAPSRFMLLAVLGLSVLAGAGFDRVSVRLAASTRLVVAAIVAALIVAEFAVPLGSTAYRAVIPSADRWLAQQPKPFVVAEVPLPPPRRVLEFEKRQSEYMLHSLTHWQKTIHGWSGLQPPNHLDLYYQLLGFPDEDSLRSLTQFRVDYIVVHTDLYPPGEWAQVERRMAAFQGWIELRYADDAGRVYALRRAPDRSR